MARARELGGTVGRLVEEHPLTRRQFVIGAVGVAGAALVIGVRLPDTADAAGAGGQVGAWLCIGADESVTIVCPNSEMGQGTSSALPQILAEELMVDWASVRVQLADADPAYANPMFRAQLTGGSTAVRGYYNALLLAGAQAREMMVAAAMTFGGGARGDYTVASGVVANRITGARWTYGQLAATAATLTPPANPPMQRPNPPRLIGQPLTRLDLRPKVNGSAVFGIDVRQPGMAYAAVRLAPRVGQTLATVGAAPAGVTVVRLRNPSGAVIGVAAIHPRSTWEATRAVRGLAVTWTDAAYTAATDTATMAASAQALLTSGTPLVAKATGDAKGAIAAAAKRLTATYSAPYLAHATLEPMNATAKVVAGTSCEIWAPTQGQGACVARAQALTGLPAPAIKVHTTFLGGGLGRKIETDYVDQVIQCAMALPGTPVKLTWPREEDFTHDVYRPAAICSLSGGLDGTGKPVGLTTRSVSQSISAQRGRLAAGAVDGSAVEGLTLGGTDMVSYALGSSQLVEWVQDTTANVPVGYWRSVGHSHNVFFLESFLDEMAIAGGKDPMAFRQAMLPAGSRELAVLQQLATSSAWSTKLSGVGKGVALTRCFGGTIVGEVAEVTGSLSTGIRVTKVTAVIDCGTVVNPDTVRGQVESAILQGVAAAMWQDMPFTQGAPARRNFTTYRMGKMAEAPTITVVIMPANGNPPSGVGEPGLPPVAPAIGNAIANLTKTRLRSLPFFPQAVPVV